MTIEEQAKAALQALVPIDLANIATAAVPAPPFTIEGLVPTRVVTLLGGHGGAGKSILALTLAAHHAAGAMTWAGHRFQDGPALFVSLEDPGEVVRYRLKNIIQAYGLDADKVSRRLRAVDGTAGDGVIAQEFSDMGMRRLVFTSVLQEIRAHAAGCRLIVIDNASDAYDGNENDRRLVRAFMRGLGDVAREHDAGVLLLAHIDKQAARFGGNGNTFSGSTAWHNSARSRLALIDDNGAITLTPEKLNLGRKADPIPLTWTENGVLVPAQAREGQAALDDASALLGALQAASEGGVEIGVARTGPTNTHSVLSTFHELPDRLKGPRGRSAFWNALGQLTASGRVRTIEIRTASRNLRKVLAITPGMEPTQPDRACVSSPHPYALRAAHEGADVCGGSRELPPFKPTQTHAAAYRARKEG
ncbi:MAG: AAA family ATPase [Arenimonas sp.]|uniref:AAA family ATPase n=1 Tax=Arenimonas sp. TaxID=1872635 RepID=UPI0025C4D652|nr:AAA family ATPase [Arenimonas sp.]MBW8366798.1 AAA family ATPase [Arenimonas sp.]